MTLQEILQLLARHKSSIQRQGVESLAIFGSTARNSASPTSDVDILVHFESPPTYDQYIETKFLLEELLGAKVDLVIEEGLNPLVKAEVEKEAIIVWDIVQNKIPDLYEQMSALLAEF